MVACSIYCHFTVDLALFAKCSGLLAVQQFGLFFFPFLLFPAYSGNSKVLVPDVYIALIFVWLNE